MSTSNVGPQVYTGIFARDELSLVSPGDQTQVLLDKILWCSDRQMGGGPVGWFCRTFTWVKIQVKSEGSDQPLGIWVSRTELSSKIGRSFFDLPIGADGCLAVDIPAPVSLEDDWVEVPEVKTRVEEVVVELAQPPSLPVEEIKRSFLADATIEVLPLVKGEVYPRIIVNGTEYSMKREIGRGAYKSILLYKNSAGDVLAVGYLHKQGQNFAIFSPATYEKLARIPGISLPRVVEGANKKPIFIAEFCEQGSFRALAEKAEKGDAAFTFSKTHNFPMFARSLLKQLSGLHQQGLYHRDLRPDNILMTNSGEPLISDWDLLVDADNSPKDVIRAGTNGYQCPIFWNAQYAHVTKVEDKISRDTIVPYLAANDVYSLGWVLLEAFYGSSTDEDYPDAMNTDKDGVNPLFLERYQQLVGSGDCQVPDVDAPETISSWDDLILSMFAKDPAKRPSAEALYRASLAL